MASDSSSSSNSWLMPTLLVGGLAIGGIFFLPTIIRAMKESNGDVQEVPSPEEILIPAPRYKLPLVDLSDLVNDIGAEDDAYIITDDDFDKLDIGKKDKRFLNRRRKIRDARLERVLYGDNPDRPYIIPTFSGFVNSVNPYGQGQAKELVRLASSESMSRSNTQKNTLNLY